MTEYLSEHFTLDEMIYSDTVKLYKIDNTPSEYHKKALKHTCEYLAEPIRALLNQHYGCKVIMKITSGYRGPALNAKIPGASKTSQHCNGCAFDFIAYKVINKIQYRIVPREVYTLIKGWVKSGKLSVDQCIDEYSGGTTWTHCSYSDWGASKNRKQFLIYKNGKYVLDN